MNVSRAWHTATLLPNGTVLVIGGNNGVDVGTAELYNPVNDHWDSHSNMNTSRYGHTATLLSDGRVLVGGGRSNNFVIKSVELFDPAQEINNWSTITDMNDTRENHTATLLPDGQVLITGGSSGLTLKSSELFDLGLKFNPLWRPDLNSLTSPLSSGQVLEITGTGLRGAGLTEASGSATNNSASNYPLIQLRSNDNQSIQWINPDPDNPYTATSFTSQPINDFPSGLALVTAFVNGIPSISKFILISTPPPTPTPNPTLIPPVPSYPVYLPLVSGG